MPAPWSMALAPANGMADTRSACAISAAPTARPSWASAETRQAASPAACGAAMLVPPLISLPVSQRGTDENASPGVTMSGFATSPPRDLHQPTTSAAGGAPPCAGRANAPGKTAPTDSARSAEPGKPMVRSEEHTSELQSRLHLVCRLLLEKKKKKTTRTQLTVYSKRD